MFLSKLFFSIISLPLIFSLDTYAERRNYFLQYMRYVNQPITNCKFAGYYASLYYYTSDDDLANQFIQDYLIQTNESRAGFCDYSLMQLYARYHHRMPYSLKDDIKENVLTRTLNIYSSPPDPTLLTPNQYLMRATSAYLAGQYFGHPNWKNATIYLNEWFDNTTHQGMSEFDSTTYLSIYFACLTTLSDSVMDPMIQRKAQYTLHYLYLSFVNEWLYGWWISVTFRDYIYNTSPEASGGATITGWLVFGHSLHYPNINRTSIIGHVEPEFTIVNALSLYTSANIPTYLQQLLFVKGKRFIQESHYACKSYADPIDWGWKWAYKTSYITNYYGLASYSTEKGIPQQILPHFCNFSQWLIRWPSINQTIGSTIFIRQETDCLSNETRNPFTPNEQILHHENSMLGVYNIQFGRRIIQLWIPLYLEKIIHQDNWIFIQQNQIYIAIQFYQPMQLFQIELLNGVYYQIYTSHGSQNAAIVLTIEKSQYPDFQSFITDVTRIKRLYLIVSSIFNTTFSTIAAGINLMNDTMFIQHDGNQYINNHLINYTNWPSIQVKQDNILQQLVFQKQNDPNLYLNIPNLTNCYYNFNKWVTNCL